ncbi:NUDIX hydrolase [Leptolyngbya sp. NK1-12]|uniref:NUDIX hydrolase n=1 Tax=Leptolyngbya sp. NK1-12 TaxID=2547451 RepID=A0AA97AKC0_9CYAN|nr:NUDIX hydrolase [Leptolyngbya sp. NK1-12]WNZ25921.1 NUDIX hydrolase [Leptolyngbya sp. NK1-12]
MTPPETQAGLQWLYWAQRLQAIAQNGLTFTENPYDVERFKQILTIASEMMAEYTDADPQSIYDLFAQQQGYATPKVDARGAVFQNDKVLLVLEREDQKWTLPGGWVDVGEPPSEAVVREVYEESGYQTRVIKLAALYDRNKHPHPPHQFHAYKLFFLCELIGGEPATSIETDAVDFFSVHALPELSLGRVLPDQILRLYEHWQHPEWATEFD